MYAGSIPTHTEGLLQVNNVREKVTDREARGTAGEAQDGTLYWDTEMEPTCCC